MKTKTTFLLTFMLVVVNVNAQTLEARYTLDGGYTDASGNNRTLYATGWDGNNSAFDTTTPPEGSSFFRSDVNVTTYNTHMLRTENGSGAPVNAPTSLTGDNPRTITAWVKVSDVSGARAIAGLGGTTTNTRFDLLVNKTSGALRCEKAGTGFHTTASISDGYWYFVAVTYNQSTANLYIGSASMSITAASASASWSGLATADGPLMVANGAQNNRPMYGGVDDVRFYSGALNIAQLNVVRTGATLGVNDIAFGANELKAYPTAVTDVLNLKTTVSGKLGTTVYNILGKAVTRSYGSKVDMGNLASGIYIVKVRAGNKVATLKVVKK